MFIVVYRPNTTHRTLITRTRFNPPYNPANASQQQRPAAASSASAPRRHAQQPAAVLRLYCHHQHITHSWGGVTRHSATKSSSSSTAAALRAAACRRPPAASPPPSPRHNFLTRFHSPQRHQQSVTASALQHCAQQHGPIFPLRRYMHDRQVVQSPCSASPGRSEWPSSVATHCSEHHHVLARQKQHYSPTQDAAASCRWTFSAAAPRAAALCHLPAASSHAHPPGRAAQPPAAGL